ncbi:ankyrin repeat domain-containing protein [Candidatus Dependentiae bacterium]
MKRILSVIILCCVSIFSSQLFAMEKRFRAKKSIVKKQGLKQSLKKRFFEIVKSGNIKKVKKLLVQNGSLIFAKDKNGLGVIDYADKRCHFKLVQYLIEVRFKECKDWASQFKPKMIHLVAAYGAINYLKYLIESNIVDINEKDSCGGTAIFWAVSMGKLGVVKYFIEEKGVDINIQDGLSRLLIDEAAALGKLSIVKYLVEKKVNLNFENNYGFSPIHFAFSNGQFGVLKYLIKKGVSFDLNKIENDNSNPGEIKCKNFLKIVSNFDNSKNKFDFVLKNLAKRPKNVDVEDIIVWALKRRDYIKDVKVIKRPIIKDGGTQTSSTFFEKLFSNILKCITGGTCYPGKNKVLGVKGMEKIIKCFGTKRYCALCTELFDLGKRIYDIKKAILKCLSLKEKDYNDKFYAFLMKDIGKDKSILPEVQNLMINRFGGCQIQKNIGRQIKKNTKRVKPDIVVSCSL